MPYTILGGFSTKDPVKAMKQIDEAMGGKSIFGQLETVKDYEGKVVAKTVKAKKKVVKKVVVKTPKKTKKRKKKR